MEIISFFGLVAKLHSSKSKWLRFRCKEKVVSYLCDVLSQKNAQKLNRRKRVCTLKYKFLIQRDKYSTRYLSNCGSFDLVANFIAPRNPEINDSPSLETRSVGQVNRDGGACHCSNNPRFLILIEPPPATLATLVDKEEHALLPTCFLSFFLLATRDHFPLLFLNL